ncbi:endocuticle structural glycoprotein SgAbd-3-like [Episyrphus balteatus]|uniref:endocuticle structural glycoprotein SgAbd-3-like n=1 Tax=Episyrphus balteatus TaxID=286459 RepID=UPI002486BB43|nr:endocuticle structural glycoprotein SgAbd-3-like [Episyrphus balteatus]
MHSILIVCLAFGIAAVNCAAARDGPVLESTIGNDGNFHLRLEDADGTKILEDGHLKKAGDKDGEVIEGLFSFIKDGQTFETSFTADENGYQPKGAHIPTPPPVPEAIVRALEYIAKHPAVQSEKLSSIKG